eukprot:CAMPEP_0178415944 /NCGR_PEP_ID=MMETSP0689_2-20121128/23810_1 /TAXON_ID=160604 /ORGANISM="Amphidinium massartii, Strain CS-259" /LENGTH=119 /DNA_ID=CAMNT_0020037275 /DNA_START=80 /DNA_END=439 /DNA_ORIENTATION=-
MAPAKAMAASLATQLFAKLSAPMHCSDFCRKVQPMPQPQEVICTSGVSSKGFREAEATSSRQLRRSSGKAAWSPVRAAVGDSGDCEEVLSPTFAEVPYFSEGSARRGHVRPVPEPLKLK